MTTESSRMKQFDIVLEGWLQKKNKHVNLWTRKWIILSTECIYTYKNKEAQNTASEIIYLSDVTTLKHTLHNTNTIFILVDRNNSISQFQCEHQLHAKQWMKAIDAYTNCIKIPINIDCKRNVDYCCRFSLPIPYKIEYKYSINTLIKAIIKHMQRKYPPIQFEAIQIITDSFIANDIDDDIMVTHYDKEHVIQKGVHLLVDIAPYHHDISSKLISCYNMKDCSIYSALHHNVYTKQGLDHLNTYSHTKKEKCKLDPCSAHQRVINGGNSLNDICHITLYQHPPRRKRIQNCFSLNDEWAETKSLYSPTIDDMIECVYNEQDGYLKTFIAEIIRNGFKKYLYLSNDDRFENKDKFTIMNRVNDKIKCIRHKQIGSPLNRSEMLSIILYTSTECNESLCNTQCNGEYDKWKWFDYCLYNAILKLSKREHGSYTVYTALINIECDTFIEYGFLKTYLSSCWVKDVVLRWHGTLFEIDAQFREKSICCDVSWISSFGSNECEVLFARSIDAQHNCFECNVSNDIIYVLPLGATEKRKKELINYPLMQSVYPQVESDNIISHNDILKSIDGVTEDIICGYLRRMNNNVHILIQTIVTIYYFNIYQESIYLYPQYVSYQNLNNMLLFEPNRVTKYPNIVFHENTKQLAIGTTTLYLYSIKGTEIKLKSSKKHSVPITAVQFCNDATYLVSYSANQSSLKIWDITKDDQQCIKECLIMESSQKTYSFAQHLMYTKVTWKDGVVLELPEKTFLTFPALKTSKTHKTLIFIVESMNKLKKSIFANSTDVLSDLPITSVGIDEAYNLSRYLNKHSSTIHTTITDYEKQGIEIPIQDALNLIKMDILSPNNRKLLQDLSPDLLSKCEEVWSILQEANDRIQGFKQVESKTFNPLIERQRTLIVSDYYKDIEKAENNKRLNPLEMSLKLQWVLDELESSNNGSIVVSSDQRRAVSTVMIALWDRFERENNEYIHLIPYLKDFGYSFSETQRPSISDYEKQCKKMDGKKLAQFYKKRLEIEPLLSNVDPKIFEEEQQRLEMFCDWLFDIDHETVIICAHCDWFIAFLNLYLPQAASFCEAESVPNCSVVGLRICCDVIPDGSTRYQIIESSITNIHRGFK